MHASLVLQAAATIEAAVVQVVDPVGTAAKVAPEKVDAAAAQEEDREALVGPTSGVQGPPRRVVVLGVNATSSANAPFAG